jgi:hypothetical protein
LSPLTTQPDAEMRTLNVIGQVDQDEEEQIIIANQEFVKAFDAFSTFKRAANYIEDWIRAKRHNATDFAADLPAILSRGLIIRRILVR